MNSVIRINFIFDSINPFSNIRAYVFGKLGNDVPSKIKSIKIEYNKVVTWLINHTHYYIFERHAKF